MKPPNAGKGRVKGVPNRSTTALKEAILQAAEKTGADMQGKGGLTGYLTFLAKDEPKSFAMLLGKVLPMQVTGADGGPVEAVTEIRFRVVDPNDGGARR